MKKPFQIKTFNSKALILLIIVSGVFGCIKKTSNSKLTCDSIPGLDSLLSREKIILLGEIHGTKEGPRFVEQIVCHALEDSLSISIGLELPYFDEQVIKTFINSKGEISDKSKILNLPFWSQDYQDGRTSKAMLNLLEALRVLKANGADIEIFLLDDPKSSDRNIEMARRIIHKAKEKPSNFLIVLTGNYHNMIHKGSGQMGRYVLDEFGEKRVVSLNQSYSGGTAWIDTTGKGAAATKVKGRSKNHIGIFFGTKTDKYHGTFGVDSIHHSVPAKRLINQNR